MAKTEDPFGVLGSSDLTSEPAEFTDQLEHLSDVTSSDARPGDSCPDCGYALVIHDISYECPECHRVFEAADIRDVLPVSNPESPGAQALRGRLRVVGRESNWYQPDLDRTNPGESCEVQKKSTYQELVRLNTEYGSRGGNPFPLDVLNDVAERYNVIQKMGVKRSQMKRVILAAFIFHTCFSRGFSRSKTEAAQMMQLQSNGIARGDDYLRSVNEEHPLEINMNCNRTKPHIISTFAQLGFTAEDHKPLQEAVAELVSTAVAKYIGHRSILRSKVVAATYEILRRKGLSVTLDEISTKCSIRKHTITRFLKQLGEYHSHFAQIYRNHGLNSEKLGKTL